MAQAQTLAAENGQFVLRFDSLFNTGRALSFPCDEAGHVDLDRLSEASRHNYLAARALMGREYGYPSVIPIH